jgi:hypothetical protein
MPRTLAAQGGKLGGQRETSDLFKLLVMNLIQIFMIEVKSAVARLAFISSFPALHILILPAVNPDICICRGCAVFLGFPI